MVWFIVLLAVIVVGLTWLAVQGKMGGMPPLVDDRPGLDLPDGDLTAQDLRGVRLAVTMRGYSMAQVDALIDRLAAQMDGQPYHPTDEYAAWSSRTDPAATPPQEVVPDEPAADEPDEALEDVPSGLVDETAPAVPNVLDYVEYAAPTRRQPMPPTPPTPPKPPTGTTDQP